MRVWHGCSIHIQHLNRKFNSYNWATNWKWNKRATTYNSTKQDDVLGNKDNKIFLSKMSPEKSMKFYWEMLYWQIEKEGCGEDKKHFCWGPQNMKATIMLYISIAFYHFKTFSQIFHLVWGAELPWQGVLPMTDTMSYTTLRGHLCHGLLTPTVGFIRGWR